MEKKNFDLYPQKVYLYVFCFFFISCALEQLCQTTKAVTITSPGHFDFSGSGQNKEL